MKNKKILLAALLIGTMAVAGACGGGAKKNDAPAEDAQQTEQAAPAEGQEAPAEGQEAPAENDQAQTDNQQAPAEGQEAPADQK